MIKPELVKEIEDYCKLNDINFADTLDKIIKRGFTIEKYGETPKNNIVTPKEVIKEVIREVPVEKIVEVIKEVPVEKIVTISDDVKVTELLETIDKLKEEHLENMLLLKESKKVQADEINKLRLGVDDRIKELETKLNLKEIEIIKLKSAKDIYGE